MQMIWILKTWKPTIKQQVAIVMNRENWQRCIEPGARFHKYLKFA